MQRMSRAPHGPRLIVALGIALSALLGQGVHAQSEETFDPLFSREAGPFDVAMGWVPPSPQVGYVNIAVKPALVESGEPVTDARILLVAEDEPGSPVFEVVAVNSPTSPTVYRANLKFEEAGNWVLHVQVDSRNAGTGDFRSPIVILPAPIEPGAQGGWVFLGIVVVLAAGGLYVAWSIRKAQAAQQAHPPTPR